MSMKILVADKLADEGLEYLKQTGAAFDAKVGLKEDELAAEVGKYDAMIVRSNAKVTAKVLANPGKLKAIARAGVGVDNIHLDTATAKGVLVLNTAAASTLSTAEHALALMMKKIAGAAIDVFVKEPPPQDHPLFGCENVVLTPHLGASTDEAQTAVSVDACQAIVAYLKSGEIRGAVNAGGLKLDLPPDEAPLMDLARRIGMLLSGVNEGGIKQITLRASGTRAPKHMNTLLRLAAVELLRPHLQEPANVINVEHVARERNIELVQIHEPEPPAGLGGDIVGVT